jgi:hypothetical protein
MENSSTNQSKFASYLIRKTNMNLQEAREDASTVVLYRYAPFVYHTCSLRK